MGTQPAHVRQHASAATVLFAGLGADALELYDSKPDKTSNVTYQHIQVEVHLWKSLHTNMRNLACSLRCIWLPAGFARHFHTTAAVHKSYRIDQSDPQSDADNHIFNYGVAKDTGSISLLSIMIHYKAEYMDTGPEAAVRFVAASRSLEALHTTHTAVCRILWRS